MAASTGIGVESYAELYSTILGWHQYNLLWNLLTDTGLVLLPFLGLLFRHVLDAVQSQTGVNASLTTLKRLEVDVVQMLVVIILVGQPLMTLKTNELTFIKLCDTGGFQGPAGEVKIDDPADPTLYRQSQMIGEIKEARIPVWWFAVMSVSSGITHAAKKSMPCLPYNKDVLHSVRTVLGSGFFKEDVRRFIAECYGPVKNFVTKGHKKLDPSEWNEPEFRRLVEKHGKGDTFAEKLEDVDWEGSPVYLEMPGQHFYGGLVPKTLRGSRTALLRQVTCKDWWEGFFPLVADLRAVGLKERLLESFHNIMVTQSEAAKRNPDQVLAMIFREVKRRQFVLTDQLFPSLNAVTERTWKDVFYEILAGLGLDWDTLVVYPVSHAVQTASPIVIAMLLMSLYVMLPLGLVISSYSLQFVLAASVGLFTMKFLSYFFMVAYWLDQNLLLVTGGEGSELSFLASRTFNFVINGSLFAFPILFMMVMSWTGINIGSVILNAFDKLGGRTSAVGTGARWLGHQIQQVTKLLARLARKLILKF